MQPTLCSRCKKNVAVVFISKMEGDKTTNEGLCLKCAKELGLPQVDCRAPGSSTGRIPPAYCRW